MRIKDMSEHDREAFCHWADTLATTIRIPDHDQSTWERIYCHGHLFPGDVQRASMLAGVTDRAARDLV